MSRLLLVSPSFHGYWRSIERAFEALGHSVTTVRYDDRGSLGRRVLGKVRHELPARMGRGGESIAEEHTDAATEAVLGTRYDVVLVVKGDTLLPRFWDAVEHQADRWGLWLYDELARMSYDEDTLRRAGSAGTYSRHDASVLAELGLRTDYVPLAYEDLGGLDPQRWGSVAEITFAGARYPNRSDLLTGLVEAGLPVRAYGRDWSRHPVDRARTWDWVRPPVPGERELPLREAHRAMADSAATLNIHGSSVNDGFTMRTFEASGAGALQLIDRADVDAFYVPGEEVLVFDGVDDLADQCRRALADTTWSTAIRRAARRRTLAEHTFVHRARALEALWD